MKISLKQVIVVNAALKLPKGKLAAQAAHAAVAAFLEADEETQQGWLDEGMSKVVLRADGEADLIRLHQIARAHHIPAQLIEDAGRTVIPEGTLTCLGLGPAPEVEIDRLTAELKLL